jgi:hypothetical protein
MGVLDRDARRIQGKIVYFGGAGAGTTQNAQFIYRKLKREHRGELRLLEVRGQPSATYEYLPVQLGAVQGYQTAIQIYTVPPGDSCRAERGRILEDADGLVFVADLRPERHAATQAALHELREHLAAQERTLEDLVLVVQYNHRDEAGENDLERLHRGLALRPAGYFEAIATEGTGVLQTLTTLSKLVLGKLRQQATPAPAQDPERADPVPVAPLVEEPAPEPTPEPAVGSAAPELPAEALPSEEIVVERGEEAADFALEPAGPLELSDGALRIPLRLVERETGRKIELRLRVGLEI